MQKSFAPIFAGALLCAVLCNGQVAPVYARDAGAPAATSAAQAVTLAAPPAKVGDTVRYRSQIKADFSGSEVLVERKRKDVIKEVKGNQDVVIESNDEGGTITVDGNANDIPAGGLIAITVNKMNTVLSYQPGDENQYISNSSLHLMALTDRIIFPDHPVKPGDTWTTEVDNPQVKGKKITIKTTFVGEEKADGVTVWRVKQSLEADTEVAGNMLKATTTALLDATTGQMIESEQNVKGLPTTNGEMNYTGTTKRVKPDAEKTDKGAGEKKP